MRILHIAPQNVAGVPITFVRAERQLGHESRLITFYRDPRGYEEDVCLELPLFDGRLVRLAKRVFVPASRREVTHRAPARVGRPPVWQPGPFEALLQRLRELLWKPAVERALRAVDADRCEIVQYDGGLDFFRDGRVARRFKAQGKLLVCCYTGSDLRTRGLIPAVDSLADLRVTVEFDHKRLYPGILHIFFPFEPERMPPRKRLRDGRLRIGHAPSVRKAKGTPQILAALHRLQQRYPEVEIVLIEGRSYTEALELKATCDVFVDQIGDLGYGINSLEALAMGIPVASSLAPGFAEECPDHPFLDISDGNLEDRLEPLVRDEDLREELGRKGREWVGRYHDARAVVRRLHAALGLGTI
ncbi:MAG: hypothetical protein ONB23_04225 [candidate division KSB1 bacterium]|nr:hypothetical protein [candidate division KSB1 bacterium]